MCAYLSSIRALHLSFSVLAVLMLLGCTPLHYNTSVLPKRAISTLFTHGGEISRERLIAQLDVLAEKKSWQNLVKLANYAASHYPYETVFHFANAYAYWQKAQRGETGAGGLALTAANLALRLSNGDTTARQLLAALSYMQKDYEMAALMLGSLLRDGQDTSLLVLLIHAAWQSGDMALALWGSELWMSAQPNEEAAYALALAAVASGDEARLAKARPLLSAAQAKELTQWTLYWKNQPAAEPPPTPAPVASAIGPGAVATTAYPRWDDCLQRNHNTGDQYYRRPSSTTQSLNADTQQFHDDIAPLEALPAPCEKGVRPRTALVDVTIVKSTGGKRDVYGVNTLKSLNVVFNAGLESSKNWGSSAGTPGAPYAGEVVTLTRALATPRDGIRYALNIAENYWDGVQIESRPTVTVLDRFPTILFAGRTVTVALSGQYGGTLEEKPVGVIVNVTPTFLSDDEVLLALRTTHSQILDGTEIGSFNGSLAATKNILQAQALLRMGETLVLSGLHEEANEQITSRVPILGSIPLLNLLFSQKETIKSTSNMNVLVSLRQPQRASGLALIRRFAPMRPKLANDLAKLRKQDIAAVSRSQMQQFLAQRPLPFYDRLAQAQQKLKNYIRWIPTQG